MRTDAWQQFWSDQAFIATIRRVLVQYGRRYWRGYAASFAMGAVAAGCTSAAAFMIGKMFNEAYVDRDVKGVTVVCALVAATFLTKGFALYGQAVSLARIGNQIAADCQRRIFEKLLRENLGYFADRHSSEFTARSAFAASAPAAIIGTLVNSVGRDLISLIGLVSVMVVQDPLLSLAALLVAPPALLFLRGLVGKARALAFKQFHNSTAIIEAVQETLQGMRVIKAFNLESGRRQLVNESIAAVQQASNQMARITSRTGPLMEGLGGIAIAMVAAYGGYRVIEAGAKPGEFMSFLAAFVLAYEPAKRLSQINVTLSNSVVGAKLLFDTLDSPDTEPNDDDKAALAVRTGRIEFRDVRFEYRLGEPVLRGISFAAAPGKTTALVGPSGAGKSTIFSLLLRFYERDDGLITIDDQDIAAVSRQSVRAQIGYVGQDVFLFRGSVRENIALGDPSASEARIIEAAKTALVHDFVMEFPRGYDTPVGELGVLLSAGQRQRIAIARALLKNKKFILLDEPTSALDGGSERQVAEAINRLREGRTTLVIAHRLNTIVRADCILVVDNGMIVESGTHDDLLHRGGRYAQLYNSQFRYWTAVADADQTDRHFQRVEV